MSLFGVVSNKNCFNDLFYGIDYHTHRGPKYGGVAFLSDGGIDKRIKDISETQFKGKFSEYLRRISTNYGIGVISPKEEQPVTLDGKVGNFAVCIDGAINNAEEIASELKSKGVAFNERMKGGRHNTVEVLANLINQGDSIVDGIEKMYAKIDGSVSLVMLTREGIYAASDRFPLFIGKKENSWAVASETTAFSNLGFHIYKNIQPREIIKIEESGLVQKSLGDNIKQICAFLWIYTGFPASSYEGIRAELARYNCGAALARRDDVKASFVGGIPNSGTAHAIGYANETINIAKEKTDEAFSRFEKKDIDANQLSHLVKEALSSIIPFMRAILKYDPTYGRSYTPTDDKIRKQIAKKKLVPILELLQKPDFILTEDSIVRATQLREYLDVLYSVAKIEGIDLGRIHVRPACPPLMWPCKYNISTRTMDELAARRAIKEIEGKNIDDVSEYLNPDSEKYKQMVEIIRKELKHVASLRYQRLDDMIKAIGLPREKLCLYCWNGEEFPKKKDNKD
ncbi:amidophosphoribosyltransferase [Candidatus Woesearchaeota archaeon]|nr:amidophosphoribosyltransferase [Candidatus Woesearchaeota archaeon]